MMRSLFEARERLVGVKILGMWWTGFESCIVTYGVSSYYIHIPRTQMTLVLIGKGLVSGGLTFKDKGHLDSRYTYIWSMCILLIYHCLHVSCIFCHTTSNVCCIYLFSMFILVLLSVCMIVNTLYVHIPYKYRCRYI